MLQGYVLIPHSLLDLVSNHSIRMDWDYGKDAGNKVWKFHTNPAIAFETWSWERINAMRVLEKLEK